MVLRMNILRTELRLGRRGLAIWTGVIAFTIVIYLGFFPYMQDPDMARLLDAYPESIMSAFNMTPAMLVDVNLYHGGLVMSYVLLMATIFAFMVAGSIVARDADLGTAEFLYTKPVNRAAIMASKVGAFVLYAVILWLVAFAVSTIVGLVVARGDFDIGVQAIVHTAGLLASLAAGGIAFAVAPFLNQTQATTSLGVGLGLGSFVLNALSGLTDILDPVKYLTLQHYASLPEAAGGEPYVPGLAVLVLLFAAGLGAGYRFLSRKDFSG